MLSNGSSLPIFNVVVGLVDIQGNEPQTIEDWIAFENRESADDELDNPYAPPISVFAALGPGVIRVCFDADFGTPAATPGGEVGFTDAAGNSWIRRATGLLVPINMNPIEYFGLDKPFGYSIPGDPSELSCLS